MRILITGAGGFIGRHLAAGLSAAGHDVVAAVRNPSSARFRIAAKEFIAIDFQKDTTPDVWQSRLKGIDVVINAVGIIVQTRHQTFNDLHHRTPCALFQACEQSGIKKVIQISALGADNSSTTLYHRSKKQADDCLSSLKLDWVILHPSVVYGPGAASSEFFKALSALPIVPLIGKGQQKMQPIHVNDLTQAVVNLLAPDAPSKVHINAVGPNELTFNNLLCTFRQWLGFKSTRRVAIPLGLISLGAKIAQFIPGSMLTAENIQMLIHGNTASVEPFCTQTRIKPRSINTALQQSPATQADRWHASLFFLRPLLRISIGLLWLVTGLVSLFLFPLESSYSLLAQVGINAKFALIVLYAAATLDIVLGIATLVNYRIVSVGIIQILVMAGYTGLITIGLAEYWSHPFGPIIKNIPLIIATFMMIALERRV